MFTAKAIGVYGFSIGSSVVCLMYLMAWMDMYEKAGAVTQQDMKLLLIKEGELGEIHNKVYEKVGEELWEKGVKPEFLKAITIETVKSTGSIVPSFNDIINWAKEHQDETKKLMEQYGEEFKSVGQSPEGEQK